jgi:hypothetical protein
MGRPREEVPVRRTKQAPGEPIVTLADLRQCHVWMWITCRNRDCAFARPIAITPLIIRLGPGYPVEEFRRNARCTRCGHQGATLTMRSWHGSAMGFAPWPDRFAEPMPVERGPQRRQVTPPEADENLLASSRPFAR